MGRCIFATAGRVLALVFFNRYDYWEKEPVLNLALTLLSGAVAVVPALVWEAPPFGRMLSTTNSVLVQLGLSFFVVGFGEELFKFGAVFFQRL